MDEDPSTGPEFDVCPAEHCKETRDLVVQECAPGHAWMFTGGVCGHVAFVYRRNEGE